MIHVDLSTRIHRPLPQVFTFVATPENDFLWQYGTLASARISEEESGLGTLFRVVGILLGRRIESLYKVTAYEPNRRYEFQSVSGPVESHTLYTFVINEGSVKIDLSIETDPRDLFKTEGSLVVKKFRRQYKENLAMLKSVLEAQQIVRA